MKIYIPLLYSEKVKRPDKRFFAYSVLGEDLIILLLAFTYTSFHPATSALGLFLLQISFWCVYEIGYIENDIIGDRFEEKAVLSYNYNSFKYSFRLWEPWTWSFVLSILGVVLLNQDLHYNSVASIIPISVINNHILEVSTGLCLWIGFLLVLRFLFHVYNNLNKQTRVWFYLLLQACRYGGYFVVLTTNTVGVVLLVSKIITRSIQYILYRYLGGRDSDWPVEFPRYFFFLLINILLLGAIAANNRDLSLIVNYQVLMIIVFCVLRGFRHFQKISSEFVHVKKDGSNQVT